MVSCNAPSSPSDYLARSGRAGVSLHSQVLDAISSPVAVVGQRGQVLRINSYLADLLGAPRSEMEGTKSFTRFMPLSSRRRGRRLLVQTFIRRRSDSCVVPVVSVDGVEHEIRWRGTTIEGIGPERSAALFTGVDLTERRQLQRSIISVANAIHQQVSQDLHDTICQEVAGLKMLTQVVAQGLADVCRQEGRVAAEVRKVQEWVQRLVSESDHVSQHARDVSHGISPCAIAARDIPAMLAKQVDLMNKFSAAEFEFVCDASLEAVGDERANQLYMIAREAMANASKHSRAKHVRVDLHAVGHWVVLRVADDGVGWAASSNQPGIGLDLMRHRADLIGASLLIRTKRDVGTCIICRCRC